MKKVSVIIPVYNSSKYLKECLDSVINQTYQNLEIIIINDNSNDNSLSIINSFKDKRIRIINLDKRNGVASCRNKGVDCSTGDYICFLDSDDFWYLEKIEKQVKFIEDKAFIYSDYEYYNDKRRHRVHVPKKITYNKALKNTTIFTSTVMLNMKYLTKEDLYMPNVKLGQDSSTWWKILKKVKIAYGMNEVLSIYRVGNKSLSSNKIKAVIGTWKILKLENLNIFKRIHCFIFYIFNAIKRRIK
ncbi:MAG: glycosyltransferase family 2 protein [Bacilli bacterium]|nr:glycosyltransferase family 2 protein [Bacilli bacterium]